MALPYTLDKDGDEGDNDNKGSVIKCARKKRSRTP